MTMDSKVVAALIGAFSAIITILLKDFILSLWRDWKQEKKDAEAIFRRYSDPLIEAVISLLWRLNEILYDEHVRGAYLKPDIQPSKFVTYKRLSTVYRIAALLGWMRALQRELSFLRTHDVGQLKEIKISLSSIEQKLADGKAVEIKRVKGLVTLWELPVASNYDYGLLGTMVDDALREFIYKEKISLASQLSHDKQDELCLALARLMSAHLRKSQIPPDLVRETRARAIRHLSYKEAWLYRDWQDGIGDLMTTKSDSNTRSFDVIGYREFEELSLIGTDEQKRWLKRVAALVEDLDPSGQDEFDARLDQLKSLSVSVSKLLKAIVSKDEQLKVLAENTLELANRIDPPERPSATKLNS
jgi:hypothetical protein